MPLARFAKQAAGWKGSWPDDQPSGVYSGGPYSWQEPAQYYRLADRGRDWVFKDETGLPSQPPYATAAINYQYYDPTIRYELPYKADGTRYPAPTLPTATILCPTTNIFHPSDLPFPESLGSAALCRRTSICRIRWLLAARDFTAQNMPRL